MKDLWKNMKPATRIAVVVCMTAIVMALIFTGQLDVVAAWFK